jgi:N-ethylmaleimide reductase
MPVTTDLFTPFALGGNALPNRIVMAPMTRTRATVDGTPKPVVAQYYAQRASAGLIVTECTEVSLQARGIYCAPGMHTSDQVAAWKEIVAAVHAAGGRIYSQLWHGGRTGHSSIRGGALPVAPSAIAARAKARTPEGLKDLEVPRALETSEVARVVRDFRRAAENAVAAGFDGVELHGANGYLVDEFLQDGSNQRTDRYGGSALNRCRFALEVMESLAEVWGAERTGIKISPSTRNNDMMDSDPLTTFGSLVRELGRMGVGYVHVMEPSEVDLKTGTVVLREPTRALRPLFSGAVITNVGYTMESGNSAIERGIADFVSFGKPFISNPDLPARLATRAPLAAWDVTTFYGADERGYTTYPSLA